jgi:2-amino-4-hydroxy-6-hydroxymethyldihydropteridine diphosphokinase
MNKAYLLIGGNIGDRIKNLYQAKNLITKNIGGIIKESSVYQTASWGIADQLDFLNQVLFIRSNLSAEGIMKEILSIENKMGRIRTQKNASRIIDIDILFFNDEIIDTPNLIIPHPQIQNRKFVLAPLLELSPQLIHPIFKKTIAALLNACTDNLTVNLYTQNIHAE